MNEEAGYLQDKPLLEECADAVSITLDSAARSWIERWTFEGGIYEDAPKFPSKPYRDVSEPGLAKAVIEVLRRRHLLTDQAIEILKREQL